MVEIHCDCSIFESCEICDIDSEYNKSRNKLKPKITNMDIGRSWVIIDEEVERDNSIMDDKKILEIRNKCKSCMIRNGECKNNKCKYYKYKLGIKR